MTVEGAAERFATILFDVDRTLITSGGAGAESWRRAFDELYGRQADITAYSDTGMTDPEVARRTFTAVLGHDSTTEELEGLMAARQRHLPDAVSESKGYRVLPGVIETLERLQRENILLGITTGGTKDAAEVKLARGDLNRFFSFGGYGSDSENRTELTRCAIRRAAERLGDADLDPSAVLTVGDTPFDVEAGHGAGAVVAAVATGKFSAEELKAAGADAVLSTLEEPLEQATAQLGRRSPRDG